MTLLASLALVAWLKKTISIVSDTPKVRFFLSNFWGAVQTILGCYTKLLTVSFITNEEKVKIID